MLNPCAPDEGAGRPAALRRPPAEGRKPARGQNLENFELFVIHWSLAPIVLNSVTVVLPTERREPGEILAGRKTVLHNHGFFQLVRTRYENGSAQEEVPTLQRRQPLYCPGWNEIRPRTCGVDKDQRLGNDSVAEEVKRYHLDARRRFSGVLSRLVALLGGTLWQV